MVMMNAEQIDLEVQRRLEMSDIQRIVSLGEYHCLLCKEEEGGELTFEEKEKILELKEVWNRVYDCRQVMTEEGKKAKKDARSRTARTR